jgi:hypothetical protein
VLEPEPPRVLRDRLPEPQAEEPVEVERRDARDLGEALDARRVAEVPLHVQRRAQQALVDHPHTPRRSRPVTAGRTRPR